MTQSQPTWTPPPTPTTDAGMGSLNPAVRETPSYVPPPIPPSDAMARPGRRTIPDRWMRLPTTRPLLTYILLGILIVIYVPMMISPELNNTFIQFGALAKFPILQGEWWRLITAAFLHGPILHIVLNGYALYMIGSEVEGFYGRRRFAAIYIISALGGSIASFIFIPYYIPGVRELPSSVGASGAIFGLIGALAVYFGINRSLFGKLGQAQFWNILFVILLNIGIGFSGFFPIDNSAHIGGLIAGAAAGFVLCPRYRFGSWRNPLVREIENTNTGPLPWIATTLIASTVIATFIAAFIYFRLN